MKIKKNTMSVLLVMIGLVSLSVISLRISNEARISNFIAERNKYCSNLSNALTSQEDIDNCFCYFEGFKTGKPEIDSKSLPLCACDCVVNGTKVKVGIIEPRN